MKLPERMLCKHTRKILEKSLWMVRCLFCFKPYPARSVKWTGLAFNLEYGNSLLVPKISGWYLEIMQSEIWNLIRLHRPCKCTSTKGPISYNPGDTHNSLTTSIVKNL